jgi:hypothetical protein
MAIMTRWRMPPGKLMRIGKRTAFGFRDVHAAQHIDGPVHGAAA